MPFAESSDSCFHLDRERFCKLFICRTMTLRAFYALSERRKESSYTRAGAAHGLFG